MSKTQWNRIRQEPMQVETREHLKSLLKVDAGGIGFTTIQKFWPDGISIIKDFDNF